MAGKPGLRHVQASHQPVGLPSPHRLPPGRRGQPLPPDATDNLALWDGGARMADTMFGETLSTPRTAAGMAPVDSVRDHAFTAHP
ncbi:hypothetical protein ACFYM0_35005 [Streptomyces sp. NPDC006487]|uniref:hypothetical protein n=1 Tax=Streptomyces sp. NPDC006487 TaxID=3364748 RepID=UPI0036AB8178